MPETFIGFDFGKKRIGVAVGQTFTGTATPLTQLIAQAGLPQRKAVQALIDEWRPSAFIVGFPLNMDETLSPSAIAAQKFGNWLTENFSLPVHYVDERLSSREARERISEYQNKYSKALLNSVAAQIILETYLSSE